MAEVTEILCPICHKPNLRRAKFCQHCGHDVVLNNDQPSDDRRYVITRIIKRGGQGAVYEGIDQHGRVYAIKEMLDRFADPRERAEAVARFNAEAELLQQLRHPRIPRVYSHFTDGGRHYLTMDFIRGEDLEQILEREGRIDEQRVLRWADEICDVLSYLHGKGFIYRDVKPSNVMIEPSGDVKLIDFGIAKLFKPTERGTQIGTPGYAPPEQYQGLATPQSDVYALAATLHHLLTGRDPTQELPFSFPPARKLVPTISERTSAALERALQKVPADRFATMDEFRAALIPTMKSQPVQVRVIPKPAPATPAARPAVSSSQAAPVTTASPAIPQSPPALATGTAIQSPKAPPRRSLTRFIGWFVMLGLIGLILLATFATVTRPDLLTPIIDLVSSDNANPGVGEPLQVTYELEITVPSNATDEEILAAFRAAFRARVQQEYSGRAQINQNIPISYLGKPEQIEQSNDQITYRARLTGTIWARK